MGGVWTILFNFIKVEQAGLSITKRSRSRNARLRSKLTIPPRYSPFWDFKAKVNRRGVFLRGKSFQWGPPVGWAAHFLELVILKSGAPAKL